jgi:hypothetical protein
MSAGILNGQIATTSAVINPAAAALGALVRNNPNDPSSTTIGSAANSVEIV